MAALIIAAVRARILQAFTMLILAALVAAVAAAGPWYATAAASRAAAGDIAVAPAAQRVLSVRKTGSTSGDPRAALDDFRADVSGLLPIPGLEPVLGMTMPLTARSGAAAPALPVSYRAGFCDHVELTGTCPDSAGEAAISVNAGARLGVDIGDELTVRAAQNTVPVTLRVVARYALVDPAGPYWSNRLFRADGGLEPAFTVLDTFAVAPLSGPTLAYDVEVPDALLRGDAGYDLAEVMSHAEAAFAAANLRLVNPTGTLLDTIAADQAAIRDGVVIALIQVLVLGLFAVGLAVRYTGRERRGDLALLKLRGSTRRGMLWLGVGQHLVPMTAGLLAGAPIGVAVAFLVVGPVRDPADRVDAAAMSATAVGVILVGGLLVLLAVEAAVLRLPVVRLLSQVAPGGRNWRADVIDLALLVLAAAAVYQVRAGQTGGGLARVAPALVALAVVLLVARLLGRLAHRGSGAALRAGRLQLGLAVAQASRRPGAHRVFAVVAVAVAMFAGAQGLWIAGHQARVQRSAAELGAPRVLTVGAPNRTALEHAVRLADPGGRQAMAVVIDRDSMPPVIAVDSSRFDAVAHRQPQDGTVAALTGTTANPPPATAMVSGTGLTLRARNDAADPIVITAVLQHEGTGDSRIVRFPPLPPGERTVRADVEGCDTAPGCRLVRWELVGDSRPGSVAKNAAVTIRGLSQQTPGRVVLDAQALADARRWRPDFAGAAMDVFAGADGLTLRMDGGQKDASLIGNAVYAVDADLPVPVVMAGPAPLAWQFSDPVLYAFGSSAVPVRLAGTAPVLPVIGRGGFLVDLDTARRVAAEEDLGGDFQVWLADDTPAAVVDALRANGLSVAGDETVAQRAARYEAQGTTVGATFAWLAAVVSLLLAASIVAVAMTVESGPLGAMLRVLRTQGLPRPVAARVAHVGSAALIVAGTAVGLLAAFSARLMVGVAVEPFTDGWDLTASPGPLGPAALGAAGLIALLVLGPTAWLSVRPVVRTVTRTDR
jgi:putative ABC transport system permease protein